jgi:basic membrane protein A
MNLKRVFFVVLMVALLMSAWTSTPALSAADTEPIRIAVIMPSATTDMAFSQSMFSALKTIQTELGGEKAMELKYTENMFKVPDAAAAIRDYATQGFDIVIAHGSQYGASVQEIAPDFPETTFAWGTDVNTFGPDNVYAYTRGRGRGRVHQWCHGCHAD